MDQFDVAIIGAGPAGTSAALTLSQRNLNVVLVDKESFPRDKVCGDAIPALAFRAMEKINTKWEEQMRSFADKTWISSSKGFAPNGKTISLDWKLRAYNSKRRDFDHFLLNLVRTETNTVLKNKHLKKITRTGDGFHCLFKDAYEFKAKMILGCDGANSVVSRELATDNRKQTSCVAVRAYYKGVRDVEMKTNEFHFLKDILPGYFWIFPIKDNWVNVGFGLLNDTNKKNNKEINLRHTLEQIISDHPVISKRFKNAEMKSKIKGYSLPIATHKRKISGKGFLLCGDAASLIDPIWGHGIDNAMWSGYFAAEHVKECFRSNMHSAEFNRQYDKIIYSKIVKNFRRNRMVLDMFRRFPHLLNILISLAQNEKMVKRVLKIFS